MNENTLDDAGRNIMGFFVRLLGFILLLAGLWVALMVLLTAKDLYEHPENIERFAVAIEKGSNIDKTLAPIRDSLIADSDSDGEVQRYNETEQRPSSAGTGNIRVSYFFAWVIVLLLLMLIARISLTAIKTGGELVLFDMQIKQLARMLAKESNKIRD
jgi:predicted cobalt transporter CbtA